MFLKASTAARNVTAADKGEIIYLKMQHLGDSGIGEQVLEKGNRTKVQKALNPWIQIF